MPVEPVEIVTNENLARSIDDLEVSVRTYEALANAGIKTIGELVEKSQSELAGLKFTKLSLTEITELLGEMDLSLRPETT